MFVPSVRTFAAVVAGLALVFGSAVGCSSEPPVTNSFSEYNTDGSLKNDPFAFYESDEYKEFTGEKPKTPAGLEEWVAPTGQHCWTTDDPDGWFWGQSVEHHAYPPLSDAPVWRVDQLVEKINEIARVCDTGLTNDIHDVVENVCKNYGSGGAYLQAVLYGVRYYDGTEFSGLQCPYNDRFVEPRVGG